MVELWRWVEDPPLALLLTHPKAVLNRTRLAAALLLNFGFNTSIASIKFLNAIISQNAILQFFQWLWLKTILMDWFSSWDLSSCFLLDFFPHFTSPTQTFPTDIRILPSVNWALLIFFIRPTSNISFLTFFARKFRLSFVDTPSLQIHLLAGISTSCVSTKIVSYAFIQLLLASFHFTHIDRQGCNSNITSER
jgi:hypothetical protein